MNIISYKTISGTKILLKRKWVLIDATSQSLGRLASFVSQILRGKHKILFTSHINCGDYVIVINIDKISIKGDNWKKKKYIRYTGFPGGQRYRSINEQWMRNPCKIFETSVRGMLPKNKLGAKIYKNLYVYAGSFHLHEAQKPIIII
ncbi:50S ribosomal protein L13 [Candidatus Uzinura diaspidicola str. ASNER]|uniref:Large ribosomal subunit protein uL13 n=1 Tax=Candidatus Uzinura diaspidicola str. ASNER TaxID=1133592 RepID=L7VMW9_9FLAO|nr:50S ribosomal protein L13 [Candidatus Uzinura diaspidicola str. ASNER]